MCPYTAAVGALVVTRAAITPGMRVLDVACGTGTDALPAARVGCSTRARAKATGDGLEIEWREGDAENLPFEDGSVDRVLSTFPTQVRPASPANRRSCH